MILMAINSEQLIRLWNNSWPAGVTMLVLGLGFAVILLVASEKLKVEQDQRIDKVAGVLPNANCGACGFAGCQDYANAVVADPTLLGKCFPGGVKTMEKIAAILNLQMSGTGAPQKPIVHCRAHNGDKTYQAKYQGIPSCIAANALSNAQACKFGCLGFGDCSTACKFDALHIIDGLATVDYVKCTRCGACSRACPRNLIEMVPFGCDEMMTVACSSRESGKVTRAMCSVGCIACGICVKNAGDIFAVNDNLARVDYVKYAPNDKTQAAMQKCPTKVIITVGKNAETIKQAAQA